LTGDIEAVFARLGGELVDPDIVMPAALPLELSGEAIRSRLCVFTDNHNRDVALRPDLTLPLALEEVKARRIGRTGTCTARYAARAFRLPVHKDDPAEFIQVGCERYGYPAGPDIDAELYTAVVDASRAAGIANATSLLGDLAVFDAFVGALGLSKPATQMLRRAFREDGGVEAVLEVQAGKKGNFVSGLVGVSSEDAETSVREMMAAAGIQLVGTRTIDEVITRLVEKANNQDIESISDESKRMLRELMDVSVPYETAVEVLASLAQKYTIGSVDGALENLSRRNGLMRQNAPAFLDTAEFAVTFGRRFTYYDGFVFELIEHAADPSRPFGAGGRYDRLLASLSGGAVDATAIGGVVRPDRLPLSGNLS